MRVTPRSKYRNIPQIVDGIKFPSKKQARRYMELRLLENAGKISDLKLEQPYPIKVNGQKVCTYRADFTYTEDGVFKVEDTKGFRTQTYRLKARLMKAVHGIAIVET